MPSFSVGFAQVEERLRIVRRRLNLLTLQDARLPERQPRSARRRAAGRRSRCAARASLFAVAVWAAVAAVAAASSPPRCASAGAGCRSNRSSASPTARPRSTTASPTLLARSAPHARLAPAQSCCSSRSSPRRRAGTSTRWRRAACRARCSPSRASLVGPDRDQLSSPDHRRPREPASQPMRRARRRRTRSSRRRAAARAWPGRHGRWRRRRWSPAALRTAGCGAEHRGADTRRADDAIRRRTRGGTGGRSRSAASGPLRQAGCGRGPTTRHQPALHADREPFGADMPEGRRRTDGREAPGADPQAIGAPDAKRDERGENPGRPTTRRRALTSAAPGNTRIRRRRRPARAVDERRTGARPTQPSAPSTGLVPGAARRPTAGSAGGPAATELFGNGRPRRAGRARIAPMRIKLGAFAAHAPEPDRTAATTRRPARCRPPAAPPWRRSPPLADEQIPDAPLQKADVAPEHEAMVRRIFTRDE